MKFTKQEFIELCNLYEQMNQKINESGKYLNEEYVDELTWPVFKYLCDKIQEEAPTLGEDFLAERTLFKDVPIAWESYVDGTCEVFETSSDLEEIYDAHFNYRTDSEISLYETEASQKVWFMRNAGKVWDDPDLNEKKEKSVQLILEKYDDIPEEGYDDWECGYWNGIMAALRWVLGDEKENLDS